jgi:hypothetical protein
MDRRRALAIIIAVVFVAFAAAPSGAKFIGTGVAFDKHFGDSIDVNINKVAGLEDTAFGLAGLDVGVDWGVDVDLATVAGYPYGYGGVGVVTQGNTGYALGLSMDSTMGSGFNGAEWGIPLAEQGITTTHFSKLWQNENQVDNTLAFLPFSGFPAL